MRCAVVQSSGALVVEPEGALCPPDGFAVLSIGEATAVVNGPFSLTPDQAAHILSAVLMVWAVGFAIRALVQAIRSRNEGAEYDQ